MPLKILGISAFYHDSAAALIVDGVPVAAAQEERFTRKKHDAAFPAEAIRYCLAETGLQMSDLDAVVFYEKPLIKFERLLETYLAFAPRGFGSFLKAMPVWLKEKILMKKVIQNQLKEHWGCLPKALLFSEHHLSHSASAFYPSPFEKAAVLCLDGVGEWATSSAWLGEGSEMKALWEIKFPHSLGLLYSAFTYFTGFKVNSGEYKLMGLAPYGQPKYEKLILDNLIHLKADGSFRLNMEYFDYCTGLRMTNAKFAKLFGGPERKAESPVTQREMDIAASIQKVTEEVLMRLGKSLHAQTGAKNLCLAGGVALNCVANGRLLREGPFENIWIQPASGDAGGALGAALAAHYQHFSQSRTALSSDSMKGGYLGPEFSNARIEQFLQSKNIAHHYLEEESLLDTVAGKLAEEKVVGWFQGRMEFGPRALGNRSILGDPRSEKMQKTLNLKIKFRESFRPFAPSVLEEKVSEFFEMDSKSPYMLLVAPVAKSKRVISSDDNGAWGIERLNLRRSEISAVTHVDYSARVQTVTPDTNRRYYGLIKQFEKRTGVPVVINTSFNVRGEPIVCAPEDAYRCFLRSDMDVLVLGNYVLYKEEQPAIVRDESWMKEFELD